MNNGWRSEWEPIITPCQPGLCGTIITLLLSTIIIKNINHYHCDFYQLLLTTIDIVNQAPMGQQKVCVHLPGGLSTWTGLHCGCSHCYCSHCVVFNVVVFVLLFCLGQTLPNGLPPWTGLHCGCLWFGCCCFCCCFVVVEIHQNTWEQD